MKTTGLYLLAILTIFSFLYCKGIFKNRNLAVNDLGEEINWLHLIGGAESDEITALELDSEGNVIIGGYFKGGVDFDDSDGLIYGEPNGGGDIFLCKYNSAGDFLWARYGGGLNGDQLLDIAVDNEGNIIVTGGFQGIFTLEDNVQEYSIQSEGMVDVYLIKFDREGQVIFLKSFGGAEEDSANSVAVDSTGNIFITGSYRGNFTVNIAGETTELMSNGFDDYFLAKYSSDGELVFLNSNGSVDRETGVAIEIGNTGNLYMCVYENSGASLGCYDPSGEILWKQSLSTQATVSSLFYGYNLYVDHNDNIYVIGWFFDDLEIQTIQGIQTMTSMGERDAYILKFDMTGCIQWGRSWGGPEDESANSCTVDNSGNILIYGSFFQYVNFNPAGGPAGAERVIRTAEQGNRELYILVLDSDGIFKSVLTTGGESGNKSYQLAVTTSGDLIITGMFTNTINIGLDDNITEITSMGYRDGFVCSYKVSY